jgi:hypothetical protein
MVAIDSDKERFEVMVQVDPITGVRIPYFVRASRGHTLEGINPMRTCLQMSVFQDFDALKLVGSVTHKTHCVAVEGTLQTGLRNDQGSNRFDVGVKAFVSAGGAMVFAIVSPYITTILPLGVVSKIMMRHPMSEEFIRRIQRVQGDNAMMLCTAGTIIP